MRIDSFIFNKIISAGVSLDYCLKFLQTLEKYSKEKQSFDTAENELQSFDRNLSTAGSDVAKIETSKSEVKSTKEGSSEAAFKNLKKLANVFAFDKSISKAKAQYEDVSTVNKYLDGINYKDLTVKCAVFDDTSKNNICNTKVNCIADVPDSSKVQEFISGNGICRI